MLPVIRFIKKGEHRMTDTHRLKHHATSLTRFLSRILSGGAALVLLGSNPASAIAACYPGTDAEPLESNLVLDTTGGSTWDAFKKAVIDPFEKECGVQVQLATSPQRSMAQLKAFIDRGSPPWDLSFTNNPWELSVGIKQGLMEPLPEGFWKPLQQNLIPAYYNDYGTVIDIYSTMIIYNKKAITEPVASWADFWDTKKFPGPRSLQDNSVNIVAALLADGVAPADIYPITDEKLKRAFRKLDEIRPSIRTFWTAGDQPVQGVHKGEFVMASAFNGRAFGGKQANYDIEMVGQNQISSAVWLFRPKKAQHPRAAAALLYFFNSDIKYHVEFAKLTGYSAALKGLEKLVPADIANNLPTSEENAKTASPLQAEWWEANGGRVQSLWKEWLTTGKVTF